MRIKIPDKIKVGCFEYTVIQDYKFHTTDNAIAQADHALLEIRLKKNSQCGTPFPEDSVLQSFLHEVVHCIDYVYNANKISDHSENTIERMSMGLLDIIKQLDSIKK